MNPKVKLSFISALQGFAIPVLNFTVSIFAIRHFGKENWGSVVQLLIWLYFLQFILNWGNKDFLLRKFSIEPSKVNALWSSNFITRCGLVIIAGIVFFFLPLSQALICVIFLGLLHVYSSFMPLVIYNQKFKQQLIVEVVSFVILISGLFLLDKFSTNSVLLIYSFSMLFKVLSFVFVFRFFSRFADAKFVFQDLKDSFMFFLLGLSGLLMSKVDLYLVGLYFSKSFLSTYQIFITGILMLQAVSMYLTLPFTKHLYRLPKSALSKFKMILSFLVFPIVGIGVLCLKLLLELILGISYSTHIYILGGLSALPSFFYVVDINQRFRNGKEKQVLIINLVGFLVSFGLIILLVSTLKQTALLIGVCVSQWVVLFIYKFIDLIDCKVSL